MKHPLWIFNSALALLFIIVLLFITFSRQHKPRRAPIKPEPISNEFVSIPTVNSNKIYERDIFDTYEKEEKKVTPPVSLPVPQPPVATVTQAPVIPAPEFLDPLNIVLKGIIFIAGQEDKNRAIIQDKQTTREATYKVGNHILDAQLIRIFNNKIVLLRSNGQQEVIYLREKDAQRDPAFTVLGDWDTVVKKISDSLYIINQEQFLQRIHNLAQLIDILDLTTAYQKGTNIGCRVGTLENKSLGQALGLQPGDIITQIDGIPATATADRFKIYKNIIQKKDGQTFNVELRRKGTTITLVYKLEQFIAPEKITVTDPAKELQQLEIMQEKQLKALETQKKLLPMTHNMQKRDRSAMRAYSERNSYPQRT